MSLSDYRSALITGASSGIGAALVRALTERGIQTYALARRRDRLELLASETGCIPLVLDLRDKSAIDQASDGLDVDILINNAGHGRSEGPLHQADINAVYDMIQTNVSSVLHLVRAISPGLVARRRGHIIMIGSVGGLHPIKASVYGATKGAIHLLCQNLRIELVGTGVRVTEICPGRVRTEFFEHAYGVNQGRELTSGFTLLEPEDIAAAAMHALDAPQRVNITTVEMTPTEQAVGGLQIAESGSS